MSTSPGTIRFKEISASPSAPSAGYGIIYMKTDNVLYIKDSSGAEVAIGTSYGITGLSGDGSATGPGIASLTINYVGGQSAANIAAATVAVQQATSAATPLKIVQRDGNGDFHAHMIFSDVTGNLRGNADTATTALSTIDFTGSLDGDVSGTQSTTVVDTVGGKTAAQIATSVTDTQQATSANTASKIVKRDAGGKIYVTQINDVAPEAHASRHLPAGADPITTAAPSTNLSANTSNGVGSANSLARSDHSHAIDTSAPVTQNPDQANSAGTSASLARADHVHNIPADVAVGLNADSTNTEGVGSSFARNDHTHDLATGTPSTQTPDQTNAEGTSPNLARADHTHNIPATAPTTTLSPATSNAEGVAASFARGDHTHAISTGLVADISSIQPDDTASAGTLDKFARADHRHAIDAAAAVGLSANSTNTEGTSTSFARADHTHDLNTGTPSTQIPDQPNAEGTSASLARADHTHNIASGTPVTQTPDQANAAGTSSAFAKADHVHNIPSGAVVQIGTSNFDGSANSFAKSDHVHAHGNQTNQNLHALATPTTHGFQSATDKAKSDAQLPASLGSANQVLGVNNAGTAGEYKTLSGTANQIAITDSVGGKTFSTPQDIHAGATPTFAGENLTDRLELTEQIAPATPAATKLDIFTESSNGFSRIRALDSTGLKSTILRDQIFLFKNNTGSTLTKGQVVYANGADGVTGNLTVALAKADSSTTVPALGLVLDTTTTGNFGRVMSTGIITGVDTSAFSIGDRVYLSPTTAGALTNVKPSAPNIWQRVGVVLTSSVSGVIEVRPLATHGEELGTNSNTFSIGDNTAGAKNIQVLNSNTSSLSWNPTAARTLTIPDATDTLVGKATTDTLTNKRVQGGSLDSAAGVVGYDITNKLFKDPNNKFQLDLGTTLQTSALIPDANVIAQLHKNVNGSAQAVIQNTNTGASASSDFIANADTATDTNNYLDLGINGSNYSDPSWTINGPLDAYLYNNDNGLAVGTMNPTTGVLQFFTGGSLAANEKARFNAGQGFQLKTSLLSSIVTLTDAANIATDASLGNTFTVTLAGNRNLSAPTNPVDGQKITYRIRQDATGNRTLSFDPVFNFGSLVPNLTLTTAPNKTDYIGCMYNSTTAKWDVVAISKGF